MTQLLERKFYKGDKEVSELKDADYMIVKELLTREEAEKRYPLHEFSTHTINKKGK